MGTGSIKYAEQLQAAMYTRSTMKLFSFCWLVINTATFLLYTFKSLKAREKTRPFSAMNLKSIDINLFYGPVSDFKNEKKKCFFENIGIIIKGLPMVLDTLLWA